LIDAKLKELRQSVEVKEDFHHSTFMRQSTAKQSSLYDSGMEMFPRQNASPVLSTDPLYRESMLGKSSDGGARPKEPLSQRQSPGYTDEDDDLM
jgi:hypothetical protein